MTPQGHNATIEMVWQYGTINFLKGGDSMAEKQVKDYDKFNLRFPDGMRDAIAERAKANGRSMNSEIVQILQDALDGKEELMSYPFLREDSDFEGHEDLINAVWGSIENDIDRIKFKVRKALVDNVGTNDKKPT